MALSKGSNLQGVRGAVYIAPKTAIWSTQATYSLFVNNAGDGDIAAYLEAGTLVPQLTPLEAGDRYFIAQKRGTQVIKTPILTKGTLDTKTAYQAPVKQTSTVTITQAALAKGDSFLLTLIDTTDSVGVDPMFSYEFVSVTGSETATQVAAGIVAAYNARLTKQSMTGYGEENRYTITSSGAVITIVALNNNQVFTPALTYNGTTSPATIATTVKMFIGFGTGIQVFEYERKGDIMDGNTFTNVDIRDIGWASQAKITNKPSTYDCVILKSTQGPEAQAGSTFDNYTYDTDVTLFIETDVVGTTGSAMYTAATTALAV